MLAERQPRSSPISSEPKRQQRDCVKNTDAEDPRRFSRLSRRLRMRHQQHQLQQQQQTHRLQKFERHAVQRRSMPEIQRADLVYVQRMPLSSDMSGKLGNGFRSEEQLNYGDWKPRTEFERTYFGDINDNNPRPSSSLNFYDREEREVDRNGNVIVGPGSSSIKVVATCSEDDCYDPELPRRIDDYVVPHSPEFRTSRERLHEIFEHNRYLRRKFFADHLPSNRDNDNINNNQNNDGQRGSANKQSNAGPGFGSTETLTSQSNQSAGSSTDGRKSRAELFDNTPDSEDVLDGTPKRPDVAPALPLRYFGTDRYGGTWRSTRNVPPPPPPSTHEAKYRARECVPNLNLAATTTNDDNDAKYYASCARVTDSSSASSPSSSDADLKASIARSRESLLRHSRSLLELSSGTSSISPSVGCKASGNRRETRIERMIRRRGQSAFNKSCTDLSSMIEADDCSSRLVSPRLVGNALAASRERLAELALEEKGQKKKEEEKEEKERQLNPEDNQAPGAGTTLPSVVYGPIPYKSPRRYVEGEVTIHYRSPVRSEAKEPLSEEELARRSAENMRRVYQEERRRKYLQELHDIDSRRHTDNFIPSQKSPIPLNRYDDFIDDLSYRSHSQEQTPEPRLVARALYNFVGQTPRELTFRRGDLIFVRRQVDKNWYEGEHNAMIGLFPFNYVEIIPYDEIRTLPKKSYEGQARAKFNFIAQTNLELSLAKGELVYLSRRVDENWWEGRVGNRKGIFPVSYVDVLSEPGPRPETPVQSKPVASPAAHSMLSNGTSSGKLSMGPHHYSPSLPVNINTAQPHYNSLPKGGSKLHVAPVNETLHIDTHSEPIPYRALYNYRPQNEDELELNEGDTVYVMEKCDDGWYVGSSQRTGYFGTFPGNYVERL